MEYATLRPDARALYAWHALGYDWLSIHLTPYRRRVVDLLALERGDRVLDVGCGTGLCFGMIEEKIGPEGQLVGIDVSPEMLMRARARVRVKGWRNVTLLAATGEEAEIPGETNAALFCFVHDVLQSRPALEHVLAWVKPGGRVAAVGPKWGTWTPWSNVLLAWALQSFVTTYAGLDRPWAELARFSSDLQVEGEEALVYFAWGHVDARE
jgi:ubiquinone/menaquinone biosynthesis C-methylase UbiE